MAARADILHDTGACAPEHWVGGLAGDDLHAIAILFARSFEQCRRSISEHDRLLVRTDGVRSLSYLHLNATPPFNDAHDHFGLRDRLSQPVMEGSGEEPTPGSGAPLKHGEFILGYPDEDGPVRGLPEPEVLSRNGSCLFVPQTAGARGAVPRLSPRNSQTEDDAELLARRFIITAFIIYASLVRQFEFAQNVWINDKTFHELGNEHDPSVSPRTARWISRYPSVRSAGRASGYAH